MPCKKVLVTAALLVPASASVIAANATSPNNGIPLVPSASMIPTSNTTMHNLTLGAGNGTMFGADPQVSKPSALWGLIALSLNAMTQRSGADYFPSSDSLSPARSSLFVCIADMLVAVLWLFRRVKRGLGVKGSLFWYRKEMGLLRKKSDRQLIQGTPAVTVCFFLLEPLPQAIKIFGSSGLRWTKVWAVIFFVAWFVEVITRFVSALPRPPPIEVADVGLPSLSRH